MPRNQKRLLVHCPILDNKELVEARALGQRVAEVARLIHSVPSR